MIITLAVIKRVQSDFLPDEQISVLELLSLYGARSEEPQPEKVRLLILDLAKGNKDEVNRYIAMAKRDPDDFFEQAKSIGP